MHSDRFDRASEVLCVPIGASGPNDPALLMNTICSYSVSSLMFVFIAVLKSTAVFFSKFVKSPRSHTNISHEKFPRDPIRQEND